MSLQVEVTLDEKGRLILPPALSLEMGLSIGTILVVEQTTEDAAVLRVQEPGSHIVDREGLLVVTSEIVGDLENFVAQEREARMQELFHG